MTILDSIIGRSPARGVLFTRSGEHRKSGIRANDELACSGRANDKLAHPGRANEKLARPGSPNDKLARSGRVP